MNNLDSYPAFTASTTWSLALDEIRQLNADVADAIEQYGIGEKITNGGQYDFESGQLLDELPTSIREMIRSDENLYDAVCDLANAYASFSAV
jgi:hypothetical protein